MKKNKELEFKKLKREYPTMKQKSDNVINFLENGEYELYPDSEIKNTLLNLIIIFRNDYMDLKSRYDFLNNESIMYEDFLENTADTTSYEKTKDFIDYIYNSSNQKKIIGKMLNRTLLNFKTLIGEIVFSDIARDVLKNDIPILANNNYNFREYYDEVGQYVTKKLLPSDNLEIIPKVEKTYNKINNYIVEFFESGGNNNG